MKKVIVTGVTGQDGSYMVEYLIKNTDVQVFGVVRRSSNPNLSNISTVVDNPRFKLVMADLSDSQSIDCLVKDILPDYFINLAAQSFVGSSWSLPEQTFDVDAVGVIRCLEAIRKHRPSCRFYNAGSSEEFGDVQFSPQNEAHPLRARSPYGAAKIAARQVVKVWRESYNLYAIQGFLFNHESERRGFEFVTRKISLGVARIKHAMETNSPFEPISLGNLDARRDWSHAEDFVRGIWMMLNQDSPVEYVLSSNETHSVREFIELAFKHAGINARWSFAGTIGNDVPKQYEILVGDERQILVNINPEFYRPAEVELLHGDSKAARASLGWSPEVSFEQLVKRMVESDIKALTEKKGMV